MLLVSGRDRVIGALRTRPEGWPRNDDQSQKVTELPVEINFSLMKVIVCTKQCAALERETVLLPGIFVTNSWDKLSQSSPS